MAGLLLEHRVVDDHRLLGRVVEPVVRIDIDAGAHRGQKLTAVDPNLAA
ncbi:MULTISPECIES: hypothetical protein [Actinoalloteichus]|nr:MULTISPECIES: hypothetical protein [Actinoalloteichus]